MSTTNKPERIASRSLVRLSAGLILWSGIVIAATVVAATFAGLLWTLLQPGQIEALLLALGIVGIILVCLVIWFWAYDYRSKPNSLISGDPAAILTTHPTQPEPKAAE